MVRPSETEAEGDMDNTKREVPQQVQGAIRSWGRQAAVIRSLHASLLVVASLFSILTASKYSDTRPWFAVIAACAVGILTATDLGVKANGIRNAWRHMNAAIAKYQNVDEFTMEQLIAAYEAAEALIGDLPSGPRPEVQKSNPNGQDPSQTPQEIQTPQQVRLRNVAQ
jgi:hypothetical protein